MLDKYRVFSITYANGKESVIYKRDSINDEEFSEQEMRYFIKGEQDAKNGYKAPVAFIGGVVAGFAGGMMVNLLSPIVPGVYCAIVGSQWIRIKRTSVSDPELLNQKTYLMGYEKIARSRRVQKALLGGLVGLIGGIATQAIRHPDDFR
jgi:hypothetical protein